MITFFHTHYAANNSVYLYGGGEPVMVVPTQELGDRLADVLNDIVNLDLKHSAHITPVWMGFDPAKGDVHTTVKIINIEAGGPE